MALRLDVTIPQCLEWLTPPSLERCFTIRVERWRLIHRRVLENFIFWLRGGEVFFFVWFWAGVPVEMDDFMFVFLFLFLEMMMLSKILGERKGHHQFTKP